MEPVGRKGGEVLGKSTSAAIPSCSVATIRRSLSQFKASLKEAQPILGRLFGTASSRLAHGS